MTIKISQLGNLTAVLGNVIIPVVANVAGTLTTVKGNVAQLKTFITTEVNADIANLQSNAGAQASTLTTLTANAAVQSGILADLTANAALQAGTLATLTANAAVQSGILADITSGSGTFGNLIPGANVTYSLGNVTHQWKDLHVSASTIYVGGTPVGTLGRSLTIDGYPVAGAAATAPIGTLAGTNWNYANVGQILSHSSRYIISSAYGNGKFVGILAGSTYPNAAVYSSDGITWSATTMPNVNATSSQVTFGGDKFVALYVGTGNTATSTDGITWTFQSNVVPAYGVYGYEFYQNLVAYGNGRFVALAGYHTQRSVYSADGVTWNNGSTPTGLSTDLPAADRQSQSQHYKSIAFNGSVFAASATRSNGTGGNLIAYTTDGVTWGNIQLPWGHDLTAGYTLGGGSGIFVGVPSSGNVGIRSTDNGRTWSNISLPEPFTYTSVLHGNGQFILLSSDSSTNIAISSDGGITWSEVATPTNQYYSGAYGNNTFIATGIGAANAWVNISYSTASVDATPIGATTPSTARFTDVTVTGDLTVDGTLTVSPTSIHMGNLIMTAPSGNLTLNHGLVATSLTISSEYTLPTTDGNVGYVLTTDGAGGVTWQDPFSQTEFDNLIISYIPVYPGNANSFVSTPTRLEARESVTATQSIFAPNIFAANLTSISGLNTANIRFFDNSLQTTAFTGNFTMANTAHWTSNVTTISAALNQLAERIWNLENP